jgi:transposase
MTSLFIGIDWADEDHDVFITNEIGTSLDAFAIDDSILGLHQFNSTVSSYEVEPNDVHIAIETPHGLIVNALIRQGYNVYPINPKAVRNERKTYRSSDARDDNFDAFVLAQMIRMRVEGYTPLRPQTELTEEIRILSEDRHKLVVQKVRLVNQLRATLKVYYPAAIGLFSSLSAKITLEFLLNFPTPQDAKKLTQDEWAEFLEQNSYPYKERASLLYEKLQVEQLEASPVIVRSKRRQMIALVKQVKTVIDAIKEYDSELDKLLKQHQYTELLLSLPPVSNTLAASLIGQFSEREEFFATANILQNYGGTTPITIQSGKKRIVVFRKACNKFLRYTFHNLAFASLRTVNWAREFYDKQKAKGKSHSLALRNLANQWAEIIFAMFTKREQYDESVYLSQRERYMKKSA